MFKITNVLEKTVTDTVDSILPTLPNVCSCQNCRADIICLTLNQLPSRYVVHRYGEILSEAEFETPQRQAEVITAVMKSIHRIQGKPHDESPRQSNP